MFEKGPTPGATPKQDALKHLPKGTRCKKMTASGITGFVVSLPNGKAIASAGNAGDAWRKALDWALKNPEAASNTKSGLGEALDLLLAGTKHDTRGPDPVPCRCDGTSLPHVAKLDHGWIVTCSTKTCPAMVQRPTRPEALEAWNAMTQRPGQP